MQKAVERISKAIIEKQEIVILGDYDVDGISSTVLLIKFFQNLGVKHKYSVPNRHEDGYGLNIKEIQNNKSSLIITVDCGSSSIKELNYALDNQIDIVVLDHHKMQIIPDGAVAIVNPHRPDEQDKYKNMCAAGIVFLCIVGINKYLRENNYYSEQRQEPILIDYLDLVALATVCDVIELTGLSRAYVRTGLKVMKQNKNLGIAALLATYNANQISAETIAFFIGPRLNAAGRLDNANISIKLLSTNNPNEAKELAQHLEKLNKKRQEIESEITQYAEETIDNTLNFISAYDENWNVGVIGIVAGRLKEKYSKPTIIMATNKDGIAKASCRSINGIDIANIIHKAISNGIILNGGGHAMAAGFSIKIENIPKLNEFLQKEITYEYKAEELLADCVMTIEDLSFDFLEKISMMEPFGMGNKHPQFVIKNAKILSPRIVGENHISLVISDNFGNSLKTISFKAVNTKLEKILFTQKENMNFLGTASIQSWKNQNYINFQLIDVAK